MLSSLSAGLLLVALTSGVAIQSTFENEYTNYRFIGCRPSVGECNVSCPVLNHYWAAYHPDACRARFEQSDFLCFCEAPTPHPDPIPH